MYAGKAAIVRTEHLTMDWIQIVKGAHQDYILASCLFNSYADCIM